VFAPLTAILESRTDWRATYLVLTVVVAVATIPLHFWGLRLPWPEVTHEQSHHQPAAVVRSRPFIVLVVAMGLAAFTVYAVVVNLVPLLTDADCRPPLRPGPWA
jgi:predicted MFS family arabinose efflux permease